MAIEPETPMSGIVAEDVNNSTAEIIKKLVYKIYGLEVSKRLRWLDNPIRHTYDVILENVPARQYEKVDTFVYGIIAGIREYLDYDGE